MFVSREGVLFVLGNPLLDISAEVDKDFLDKYGLEPNNAILAEDKHKDMYEDIVQKFKVEFVPGGAAQNTTRVAQWLIGIPNATTYTGCIGKDKFGKILEQKTNESGVRTIYKYNDKEPTGTCAVLITGKNRSLCAYLAAANTFTTDHLEQPDNWALVEKSKYIYISGFPLTVCPPAMLALAQHASEKNKRFIMNLSAPFLCSVFKEPMMQLIPYVDVLFGNESEAAAFGKEHNFQTEDLKEIAVKIASQPKNNGLKGRMVVITQGADPTIVVEDGEIKLYPVIHIDPKDIVDTNGAGDAFTGGFLASFVQGLDTEACIRSANYAANLIIQRSGCTYPQKPDSVF